jgi:hypothetical protein
MKRSEQMAGKLAGLKPLAREGVSRNESEPASESLETRKDESGQGPRHLKAVCVEPKQWPKLPGDRDLNVMNR